MVTTITCDQCGQVLPQSTPSPYFPVLLINVTRPQPFTGPDLCSFECAIAWLQAAEAALVAAGYTLIQPLNGTAPAQPVNAMSTPVSPPTDYMTTLAITATPSPPGQPVPATP